MLGAEGEGLRENLKNRANAFVSIARGEQLNDSPDVGVDSMNVSVATGVLLESFLRKPEGAPEKRDSTGELGF
jgi:21S rRNA (GM2251-2'-O)-methyltransferase